MSELGVGFDFEDWKHREYGNDLPWDILKDYKREDDFMTFHTDDRDLSDIVIYLPTSPDWRRIDGFGLPAKEQKFRRLKVPPRLDRLADVVAEHLGTPDESVPLQELWKYLTKFQGRYKEELDWLRKMWYYMLYGYWCFINGKPTYIDGDHFSYLNFDEIDVGRPDYRDRDRRWFLAVRYFEETTEAPFKFKATWRVGDEIRTRYFGTEHEAEGYEVLLEQTKTGFSNYTVKSGQWVVDTGHRTVLGINYPKHRREGATYRSVWKLLINVARSMKKKVGIQSLDETHARKAFLTHGVTPFREMKWFLKPEYSGSDMAQKVLKLVPAAQKIGSKGAMATSRKGLDSYMDYATTADSAFYDSQKLMYYYEDECGKTVLRDVFAGHDQTRHCLTEGEGANMSGFTIKTSTVGEMEKKGGASFYKLCNLSKYDERNSNGTTQTMLVTLFMPAYDGLEGFIGPYGESVIDTPTPQQAAYIGRDVGAKMHLSIREMQLRSSTHPDAMKDLNEFKRLHPTQYRDCFRRNASDVGFNIAILTDRINELLFTPTATQSGKFEYDDASLRVYWVQDKNGPWRNSLVLPDDETNKVAKDFDGMLHPIHTNRIIASGDPFKYMRTEHRRTSDAASAAFLNRDFSIDDETVPVESWSTYRFICDYKDRPGSMDDASRQMLYMCLYYGALMSPEINVSHIWDFFVNTGHERFLYHFRNPATGEVRKTPGFNAQTGIKNDIFDAYRDYIENHGRRENHRRILEECNDIGGIEEMTDYDIFTAAGGCLISAHNQTPRERVNGIMGMNRESDDSDFIDISGFYNY